MNTQTEPLTAQDIWQLFRETDRLVRQIAEENRLRAEESRLRSEETDRKMREMAEENRRADEESRLRFEETEREIREMNKSTDRYLRELSAETEAKIKQVNESIGRLGNKLGDFVEEMVKPAAVRLFQDRGISVHEVHQNVTATRDNDGIEVDLLVVNDGDVIAIECKSTLSTDDVNEHLERLAKLKRLLPRFADAHVMGAITGMVLPDDVAKYAYRKGLFVIAQSGNQLVLRNDERFQPKIW